jgi:hypothetical protein
MNTKLIATVSLAAFIVAALVIGTSLTAQDAQARKKIKIRVHQENSQNCDDFCDQVQQNNVFGNNRIRDISQ